MGRALAKPIMLLADERRWVSLRFTQPVSLQTRLRVLAAQLARALLRRLALDGRRAQGRPGAGWLPWTAMPRADCVCCGIAENRATGDIPAFPAQWFDGLCRALLGSVALLPRRLADDRCARRSAAASPQDLTPDRGRQDLTILPYADHTGRVREASLLTVARPAKYLAPMPSAPTAARPAFRDDRDTPLFVGPGCGDTYALSEFR